MIEHKILITGKGIGHAIEVDDHDIANLVTSAAVSLRGGEQPAITLELAVPPAEFVLNSTATVTLDDETAKVLRLLGWTPPETSP